MKLTQKSIVLSRIPYSESSWIVKLFTLENGLQSFLFQGARKKSGNQLFPLAIIEATYFKHKDASLCKLTESNLTENLLSLYSEPTKSSLAFFIAELMLKLLPENQQDQKMFHFLEHEICWINQHTEFSNYVLWFLAKFSQFEGIQPIISSEKPFYFDYKESTLTHFQPLHPGFDQESSLYRIVQSIQLEKEVFLALEIPKKERITCLNCWMNYFAYQHNGTFNLKSLEVVKTVLND